MVGVVTQNPQRAPHSEQTLVVGGPDGGIYQSVLSRGRICGPGYMGNGVDVVRGARDGVISHLHDDRLDESWKKTRNSMRQVYQILSVGNQNALKK